MGDVVINAIVNLELTQVDNNGIRLHVGIPLSKIKEIKQIPNSNTCEINGYEINLSFDEAICFINSLY